MYLFFKKESLIFVPELESYKMSEKIISWDISIRQEKNKKRNDFLNEEKDVSSNKKHGFNLKIITHQNKIVWEAEQTITFCFSKKGKYLAYIQKKKKTHCF